MLTLFKCNCLKHIDKIGLLMCFLIVAIKFFFNEIYTINLIIRWVPLLQFFPLFFAGIIFYKLHSNLIKKNKKIFINIFLSFLSNNAFPIQWSLCKFYKLGSI